MEHPNPFDVETDRKHGPGTTRPVIVGRYYFGVQCPACKKTTPLVQKLNDAMVGGRVEYVNTTELWEDKRPHKYRHKHVPSEMMRSLKKGGVERTPTFIWSDGVKSEGGPTADGSFAKREMEEWLCRRAAKTYMKERVPEWELDSDSITDIVDQMMQGPPARSPDGGRDPYGALQEITYRY